MCWEASSSCRTNIPTWHTFSGCRTVHFFASSEKAKKELGWKPKHDFLADSDDLVTAYLRSGRHHKDIDFSVDDKILQALSVAA
jgi:hypothetical protein